MRYSCFFLRSFSNFLLLFLYVIVRTFFFRQIPKWGRNFCPYCSFLNFCLLVSLYPQVCMQLLVAYFLYVPWYMNCHQIYLYLSILAPSIWNRFHSSFSTVGPVLMLSDICHSFGIGRRIPSMFQRRYRILSGYIGHFECV